MTENSHETTNSNQFIFLALAFLAGIFAAKLWYDTRGDLLGMGVDAPEAVVVEESTEVVEEEPVDEAAEDSGEEAESDSGEDAVESESAEGDEEADADSSEGEDEETLELTSNDIQSIKEAFANKYEKDVEEITIEISEVFDDLETEVLYATGGVKLSEGPGGGGMFWVYKEDDEWVIAADGNGSPDCAVLEDAGFPEDLREGCYYY
ncbi:hypothetical protein GF360_00520 [candidate division WWE3 bacterium]|nr:hypothetical protein [candidate division WWE3 bacterium]